MRDTTSSQYRVPQWALSGGGSGIRAGASVRCVRLPDQRCSSGGWRVPNDLLRWPVHLAQLDEGGILYLANAREVKGLQY